MKLNLGCGSIVVKGWLNVDYAYGARVAKLPLFGWINRKLRLFRVDWHPDIFLHDLSRPFQWPESSVDAIYCSHVLEHFSKNGGAEFLSRCFKVLRSGGIIRILVPDLSVIVKRYQSGEIAAEDLVSALGVLYGSSLRGLKGKLSFMIQYPHKCMYDTPSLLRIAQGIGFRASSMAAFESGIPNISEIECASRTEDAVIIEAVKP